MTDTNRTSVEDMEENGIQVNGNEITLAKAANRFVLMKKKINIKLLNTDTKHNEASCSKDDTFDKIKNFIKSKSKKEPVVIDCLSSDEEEEEIEEDNEEFEDEEEEDNLDLEDEQDEDEELSALQCMWIRIGSYKYIPKEQVYVSSKFLRLTAPSVDSRSKVSILIDKSDILNITTYFSNKINIIFIFVLPKLANEICKNLEMVESTGIFFNPSSSNETYKRIVLRLQNINEENKLLLQHFFQDNNYRQLEEKSLRKILQKVFYDENNEDKSILIFPPPPEKGGITIHYTDYRCLADFEFLNDVIIDFYLKYTHTKMNPNSHIHVFSTFFYKRLTAKTTNQAGVSLNDRRHANVHKWTKNFNIFDKEFIIIPINKEYHWFLAIIVYPGLEEPLVEGNVVKQPLILIFDSLLEDKQHSDTIRILRGYLQVEYFRKTGKKRNFDSESFPGIVIELLPQQDNLTDCGVFVLQYVDSFFNNFIGSFGVPLPDLRDWFDTSLIPQKRRDIAELICNLIEEQGQDVYELGLPVLFDEDDDGFHPDLEEESLDGENGNESLENNEEKNEENTENNLQDVERNEKVQENLQEDQFDELDEVEYGELDDEVEYGELQDKEELDSLQLNGKKGTIFVKSKDDDIDSLEDYDEEEEDSDEDGEERREAYAMFFKKLKELGKIKDNSASAKRPVNNEENCDTQLTNLSFKKSKLDNNS